LYAVALRTTLMKNMPAWRSHISIEPNPAPSFGQECRQSGSSDGRRHRYVLWFRSVPRLLSTLGSVPDSPPSMGAIDKIVRRCARQIQVSSPNQQHLQVEVYLA